MLTEDMDEMVRQYYIWALQQNPADLAFPHQDAVRKLLGSSLPSISLSDEDAMYINRALGLLHSNDPECYTIIRMYYGERRSFRWMERRGKGDRKALARRLNDGLHFLRGVLCVSIA